MEVSAVNGWRVPGQDVQRPRLFRTKSLSRVFPGCGQDGRLCHPAMRTRLPLPVNKGRTDHNYSCETPSSHLSPSPIMSMQQRKNEILAKRAKLSELKRQRELRQQEFTHSRTSTAEASEV